MTNLTIGGNIAASGTGTAIFTNGSQLPSLNNTIVYGSIVGGYMAQYSLLKGITGGVNGNQNGTKYTSEEVFKSPATGDFSLLDASPAINKGSNLPFAGLNLETKDLAGNTRVYKGLIIDMGAYEFQGEPMSLVGFTARLEGRRVRLDWQTASELACGGFEVYRSLDGTQFSKIGYQPAKGTPCSGGNYTFFDTHPSAGRSYYKLLEVDLNGQSKNLGVKTVDFRFEEKSARVFPNPAHDRVSIAFSANKYTRLERLDATGRSLKSLPINATDNIKEINIAGYLAGVYMIRLSSMEESIVQKLIKK